MAYTGRPLPERGTFFRLHVYERVRISLVEVYKRVGNQSFWSVKRIKRAKRCMAVKKLRKCACFKTYSRFNTVPFTAV